jgi:hypothetical protein
MFHERRVLHRYDSFICVKFRATKKSAEYSLGITNNITSEGFNFESQDHGIESGQNIELIFGHPKSNLTVNALGELAWKANIPDSNCLTGVKFKDIDEATKSKMLEIVSDAGGMPVESFRSEQNDIGILQVKEKQGAELKFNDVQEKQLVEKPSNKAGTDVPSNGLSHKENAAIWDEFITMCVETEEKEEENMMHDPISGFNNGDIEDRLKHIIDNGESDASDSTMRNKSTRSVLLFIPAIIVVLMATSFALSENINGNFKSLFSDIPELTFRQEADMENPVFISDDAVMNDLTEKETLHTKHIQTQEKSNILLEEMKTKAYLIKVMVNKDTDENSKYFIQVGTWRNVEYAQEMLTQLKKDYPEAYIVKKVNFHKIRIPGIINKKQGAVISTDIENRFNVKPLIVKRMQ